MREFDHSKLAERTWPLDILQLHRDLLRRSGASYYDVVKRYVEDKVGKFTGAEVVTNCPSIGRSSALAALKKLTDEGLILRQGAGRGTYYIRSDSIE